MFCPPVGPCEFVAGLDGVGVFGPEDARKIGNYPFNESGDIRVWCRKIESGYGSSEGFDGVGVLWAEGVGEIGNYLFVYSDGVDVLSCL